MSKLPKIVILVLALTGVFLLISTAFNSCGTGQDNDILADTSEVLDDAEEYVDDFVTSEDDDTDDTTYDDSEDVVLEDIDYTSDEDVVEDYTTPEFKSTSTTTSSSRSYGSSGGEYMVIAGNYLVEGNADNMVRKLNNLGYNNAEIGVFNRSQYHTVIAYRSNNYSEAIDNKASLERRGIDCYVKKKEY